MINFRLIAFRGAPTCLAHAEDVYNNESEFYDCVVLRAKIRGGEKNCVNLQKTAAYTTVEKKEILKLKVYIGDLLVL